MVENTAKQKVFLRGGMWGLAEWQERQDLNPRPSVLETDALTRLSYAPAPDGRS